MSRPISGDAFVKALIGAGVLPGDARIARVVVDARPGWALTMHVQYLADGRILDVVPGLDGVDIRLTGQQEQEQGGAR